MITEVDELRVALRDRREDCHRLRRLLAMSRAQTWRARRERDEARTELAACSTASVLAQSARIDSLEHRLAAECKSAERWHAEAANLREQLAQRDNVLRRILGDGDDPATEEVAPEAAW